MSLNQLGGIASKIYNTQNSSSGDSGSVLEKLAAENIYLRNSCGYNGMFYSLNFSSYWNIVFLVTYVLLLLYFYLTITQPKSKEESDQPYEKSNIYDKLSLKDNVKSVSASDKDVAEEYGI